MGGPNWHEHLPAKNQFRRLPAARAPRNMPSPWAARLPCDLRWPIRKKYDKRAGRMMLRDFRRHYFGKHKRLTKELPDEKLGKGWGRWRPAHLVCYSERVSAALVPCAESIKLISRTMLSNWIYGRRDSVVRCAPGSGTRAARLTLQPRREALQNAGSFSRVVFERFIFPGAKMTRSRPLRVPLGSGVHRLSWFATQEVLGSLHSAWRPRS